MIVLVAVALQQDFGKWLPVIVHKDETPAQLQRKIECFGNICGLDQPATSLATNVVQMVD